MYRMRNVRKVFFILKNINHNATANVSNFKTINDMPHPTELPIFGTKLALLAAGSGSMLHKYVDTRHKQLGPLFYEKLGGSQKLVFISDPELMKLMFLKLEGKYPAHILPEPWVLYEKLYGPKRGLFFMDGEEWFMNRKIMNKNVLKENSETWLEYPIRITVKEFIKNWKEKANDGSFVADLESDLYKLSIKIILNILVGTDTLKRTAYYDDLLDIFAESVKNIFKTTTKLYGLPISWYQRLNLKPWQNFKESVDTSIYFAQKIVREVIPQGKVGKGLGQNLLEENIPYDILTRIVADFIIAAGDTTAYTTVWTLYLLSQNQDIIKDVQMNDRNYVKNVVKESMRLFPVAPFLTRILPRDSNLGHYSLKEGTPIIASIYTSGRDENNFSQAKKFAPYRWNRNDPRKSEFLNHVSSASLPFALGARSCIGKKIAILQLTEVIHQIVNEFEIECKNSDKVNAVTSQVLIPDQDIIMKITLKTKEM